MSRFLRLALPAIAVLGIVTACANRVAADLPPVQPAKSIDLQRYMGAWYVISNIPYFAEKGKLASRDVYTLTSDGKVDTEYYYRKAFDAPEKTVHSIATVTPGSGDARWVVQFFRIFHADYWVLDVAPDYSWALVGQPSRKLGWVLARKPEMDDAAYAKLLERFRAMGYDSGSFRRVPQTADQVGKPGFQ